MFSNCSRWIMGLLLALISIIQPAYATVIASPLLTEAHELAEIEPVRAQQIAKNYLQHRTLVEPTQSDAPSSVSREDADQNIRTPSSTIEAHRILAIAYSTQGNTRLAVQELNEAERLAQEYELTYAKIDIDLQRTHMLWQLNHDVAAAEAKLNEIQAKIEQLNPVLKRTSLVEYKLTIQRGLLAAANNEFTAAKHWFSIAKERLPSSYSELVQIEYHTVVGKFYLDYKKYNHALSELLFGYWLAIENNSSSRLAKINLMLAQLFFERRVYDKALSHLSQAAEFYSNYSNSSNLVATLKQMGDIYYQQGKYNLALVHYFNVLDHEDTQAHIDKAIETRLSLAATYLQLVNYPLAEQYLERAIDLLEFSKLPGLEAKAEILQSGLAYFQKRGEAVVSHAQRSLDLLRTLPQDSERLSQRAYQLMSLGYEIIGDYKKSLENYRKFQQLVLFEQRQLNQISEDAFRQQKDFAEQTIHYLGQQEELDDISAEHRKFQKISFMLFITVIVLFLFIVRRGMTMSKQRSEIESLRSDLHTHSRSRLNNLRLLNSKLSNSLKNSSDAFEQWHVGELIHEPLHDRLRFVMLDLPFLRNMYMQHGYTAGLELERTFGEFLAEKIDEPSRIYHFSDANLLYIEPNSDRNTSAEIMFEKFQHWVDEFAQRHKVNRTIRIGISDYPFLPRAYTAIGDSDLLDILLLATHIAREVSLKDKSSHWVFLKAIENAPAASFAADDIRSACKYAINQGLIKIQSSYKNEDNLKKIVNQS